jgi:hypothetical protein
MMHTKGQIMKIDERINFYLGDCLDIEYPDQIKKGKLFLKDWNNYYVYKNHNHNPNIELITNSYIMPLKRLINKYQFVGKNIYAIPGDTNQKCQDILAFSKTRRIEDVKHTYALIKCFEKERHWRICFVPDKTNFEYKKNIAVWRGSDNGLTNIDDNGYVIKTRQNNRFTLLEKYFSSPFVNVGLSKIYKNNLNLRYSHMIKEDMKIEELRSYKYILSIEGNDKDSGLNWKLVSNSVVLMSKPIYNSWLMEEKLIPNIHYVQLADDLSDLEEKIYWCNKNPIECKNIINNAHKFMKQFLNKKIEEVIEHQVISKFIKKTNTNS